MKKLFDAMIAALERGENAVLCTILASSGSTPRGAGARMAVFADGSAVGTVGGGAVEFSAYTQALEVLQSGRSAMQAYCLAPNEAADIGMVCGGDVTVYFQYFSAADGQNLPLLRAIREAVSGSENAWLIMELCGGLVQQTGLYFRDALHFAQLDDGALRPLLRSRAVLQKGEVTWYAEPIRRAGQVYIFGGGHVSQALVPILKSVDFPVTVYDPRPALACREKFPDADRILCGEFTDVNKLPITKDDYVVIMTPGHQADREVLVQALFFVDFHLHKNIPFFVLCGSRSTAGHGILSSSVSPSPKRFLMSKNTELCWVLPGWPYRFLPKEGTGALFLLLTESIIAYFGKWLQ